MVPVSTAVNPAGLSDKPADSKTETSIGTREGNVYVQLQNVPMYVRETLC